MTHPMPPFPDPAAAAPLYHPPEEFLLDYAVGSASPSESVMIGTHLAYCESCRRAVRDAGIVGGSLLDELEPMHLPPNMLNRTLSAIEMRAGETPAAQPSLSALLHENMASHKWKHLPGGFRMHHIPGDEGSGRLWLFDAPPGMKLLPHRHEGDEWTVILSGTLLDDDHSYGVGDFARRLDGEEHQPMISKDGRCVSLIMVREAPHYTTMMGRLGAPFIKL